MTITDGISGQDPLLQSVKGAMSAIASAVSSEIKSMVPSKATRGAMNDGQGMKNDDWFALSNKWGALLMLTAGAISASPSTVFAGLGAFYSNSTISNKKELWHKEALKDLAADDPRRDMLIELGTRRAKLRSDWVKIICHGTQFLACGTAAVMGAPAVTTMAATMGGLAVLSYSISYGRGLLERESFKKELKGIEEKHGLDSTDLDERSFVRENFERMAKEETIAAVDDRIEKFSSSSAGKYLQSAWEKASGYTSKAGEMVLTAAKYSGGYVPGLILLVRGATTTLKGISTYATWDAQTAIMTLSGAYYTVGGVFKVFADNEKRTGKSTSSSDDEITEDEKGAPPLPRVAAIAPA